MQFPLCFGITIWSHVRGNVIVQSTWADTIAMCQHKIRFIQLGILRELPSYLFS